MPKKDMARAIEAFSHAHGLADPALLRAYLEQLEEESSWLKAEVESLLKVQSAPAPGGERARLAAKASLEFEAAGFPKIPHCRITAELGRGGFGTVYRALRHSEDLAPVAIKVLHSGRDSKAIIDRFRRERQLHARIDSPYVARVIDVGSTLSGDPFLMMELVEGSQTFMQFAEQQQLSIGARLGLFKQICKGIQQLHLNRIYHRDLKPSNILVGRANGKVVPKIIDFGLAKDEDQEALTQEGARIGTRGYMSPEQEAGEPLDLRTDVYSLGVLLHELLTGTRPPSAASSGSERGSLPSSRIGAAPNSKLLLASRRLQSLSQLKRCLRGDLDMILLKAIAPERSERYQSVDAFLDDIERHENREPVRARGKGGLYALARLADRHRLASFSASVGLLALAVGFSVASGALSDERLANRALGKAHLATEDALLESFALNQQLKTAKQDVDQALQREELSNAELQRAAEEQALIIAFERNRIRSILPAKMESHLRSAVLQQAGRGLQALPQQQREERMRDFERTLGTANFASVALAALKHSVFQNSEASINTRFRNAPQLQATLLLELSLRLTKIGLLQMALEPGRSALALREEQFGATAPETLEAMNNLGVLLRQLGDFAAARQVFERAAKASEAQFGSKDPRTLLSRFQLARIPLAQSNGPLALEALNPLLPVFEEIFESGHPSITKLRAAINSAKSLVGRDSEAVASTRKIYEQLRVENGPKKLGTLQALYNLSSLLFNDQQVQEAMLTAKDAYLGLSETVGLDHPSTLSAANLYCNALLFEGRLDEAAQILRASVKAREAMHGVQHQESILALLNLSKVLRQSGQYEEALESGTLGVMRLRNAFREDSPMLGNVLVDFALTQIANGDEEQAESSLLEGYEVLEGALGERHASTCQAAFELASFYALLHAQSPGAGYEQEQTEWQALSFGFSIQHSAAQIEAVMDRRRKRAKEKSSR